jgi:hypothetical protein
MIKLEKSTTWDTWTGQPVWRITPLFFYPSGERIEHPVRYGPWVYSRRHAYMSWMAFILRCSQWGEWNRGKPDWKYRIGNWLHRKAAGQSPKVKSEC